ncbi:MAG: GTP 3',8-cyclase MoaA [Acidobacteriota bacterium]
MVSEERSFKPKAKVDYLRVSVTDRCHFQCPYCAPAVRKLSKHADILTFEEIKAAARILSRLGVRKVRLTGGEPLLRKNIDALVRALKSVSGIESVNLTTNGHLLLEQAGALREAGIDGVNVSLDSLDNEKYGRLTGGFSLEDSLSGIEEALRLRITPLKINVVLMKGVNDDEVEGFCLKASDLGCDLRFIELMRTGENDSFVDRYFLQAAVIRDRLKERFHLIPSQRPGISGPSQDFFSRDLGIMVGFIHSNDGKKCLDCTRMRLTSKGFLKRCLFSSGGFDLRHLLRSKETEEEISDKVRRFTLLPEILQETASLYHFSMMQIGG